MGNYYGYGPTITTNNAFELGGAALIWTIVSFVLALVGAFIVYFLFVKPNKKYENKFVNWLRRFLDFAEMLIEPITKIGYIFAALLITLSSFALISVNFIAFLMTLIMGNLLLRVVYELSMIIIAIWRNTRDINKKMK